MDYSEETPDNYTIQIMRLQQNSQLYFGKVGKRITTSYSELLYYVEFNSAGFDDFMEVMKKKLRKVVALDNGTYRCEGCGASKFNNEKVQCAYCGRAIDPPKKAYEW